MAIELKESARESKFNWQTSENLQQFSRDILDELTNKGYDNSDRIEFLCELISKHALQYVTGDVNYKQANTEVFYQLISNLERYYIMDRKLLLEKFGIV